MSSRSARVSASRERRRAMGGMPPRGNNTARMQLCGLSNARPISCSDSPAFQRFQMSSFSIAESPNRIPDLMTAPPSQNRFTSDGVASTHRMHRVNRAVDLSVSKGDSLDHVGYSLLAMHQFRDSRSILVFVVLTIVGSTSLVGQAITENFRTIKIDPKTLVLKLEEPLPLVPSPNHNFYNLFRGNTISVVHLGPEGR